jgi:hypothetical protein
MMWVKIAFAALAAICFLVACGLDREHDGGSPAGTVVIGLLFGAGAVFL